MKDLYLIAIIAGEQVAIPATQVDSVVKVRERVPVPSSEPFIAGLFALRSRVLTLIDCQYFVSGEACTENKCREAIVVNLGGHAYGLMVDMVCDVVHVQSTPKALNRKLSGGWSELGSTMLEYKDSSYLVVDPAMLVNPAPARSAA